MNLHNLNAWAEEERPDLDEQVQAQDRAAGKRPNSSRIDAESWLRANDPFYGLYYRFCLALGRQPVDWMTWDRWRSRFEVQADWKPRPVPRGHLLPLEVRSKLWPSFEGSLLAAGGFHIVSTGITGQPVGRPPAGIRQPERVRDRMGRLLREDLFEQ
jgi:hypothetical protein